MSGDQTAELLYLIGALVVVASALVARRMPIGQGLKMLAGWVLIFVAGFVLFSFKDHIGGLFGHLALERRAESTGARIGDELRIRQAPDGHFWVDAKINGAGVRFLVDSGATTTSISRDTAERAGVTSSGGFPALVRTANGTVEVERARARVEVGHIARDDLAVHMSDAFGDMNVIGMNFLSSLNGWRVEGRNLILTP